ncbi:MAG: DsrE family protein [Acidobacteria bacterium]|nr:DsrE family protein [Acidobacteriota bacterium]
MAKTVFILNDPPYGTERSYNALRLAGSLSKRDGEDVKVFLIGDAASCAKKAQKVPQGYYNAETMLHSVGRRGGEIGVCGTCMDARGIAEGELTDTTHRSSLEELTNWVQWADRTLVF